MQQRKRKPDLMFVLALVVGLGVAATEIAQAVSTPDSAPTSISQQVH